ncbi:MAG TPA: alpha/beta hydrolase, partial [Vicinamibacterales bacterium]
WFRALADLCDAFTRLDITRDLHKITAPALVIAGADDALKPVRFSEIIAREIPNAELHVIPDAGHAVFLEKPEEMNAKVMELLSRQV